MVQSRGHNMERKTPYKMSCYIGKFYKVYYQPILNSMQIIGCYCVYQANPSAEILEDNLFVDNNAVKK